MMEKTGSLYRLDADTSIGRLTFVESDRGLCHIGLPNMTETSLATFCFRHFSELPIHRGGEINRRAAGQVKAYLAGRLTIFELPLDLRAEGFYRRVLEAVKDIPYGSIRTYGEIAAALGSPGASRAVGGANGSNPLPLVIPCHRVVAAKGLGGYAGTTALKKKLLAIEQKETIF